MFLVGMLSWWYGRGWSKRVQIMMNRLKKTADFYSIRSLASTLFAPYRQIATDVAAGSISNRIHAFFDRLLSRVIGAIVRLSVISFGLIIILFQIAFETIVLISWLLIPLMPVAGLIIWSIRWMP
jgi:hypothetical protein